MAKMLATPAASDPEATADHRQVALQAPGGVVLEDSYRP